MCWNSRSQLASIQPWLDVCVKRPRHLRCYTRALAELFTVRESCSVWIRCRLLCPPACYGTSCFERVLRRCGVVELLFCTVTVEIQICRIKSLLARLLWSEPNFLYVRRYYLKKVEMTVLNCSLSTVYAGGSHSSPIATLRSPVLVLVGLCSWKVSVNYPNISL